MIDRLVHAIFGRVVPAQDLEHFAEHGCNARCPEHPPYVVPEPPSSPEAIIARQGARRMRDQLFTQGRNTGWFLLDDDPEAAGSRFIYDEAMDRYVEAAVNEALR